MTDPLIVVRETATIVVSAPGPQGPPGPAGPPGGGGYVHNQISPSASWVVNHNLGQYTSVTLLDDLGNQMYADVFWSSVNQTSITYPAPLTGVAVFR